MLIICDVRGQGWWMVGCLQKTCIHWNLLMNVVTPTIAIIPKLNQTYLTYLLTCSSPQLNTTLLECSAPHPLVTGAGENWTLDSGRHSRVTFSLFPILNDYFICIWNNSTSFAPLSAVGMFTISVSCTPLPRRRSVSMQCSQPFMINV